MSKSAANIRKKWNFRPQVEELEIRNLLAVRYWDGGGLDSLCSNAENWTDDTLPTAADTAIFDATSTKSAEVDSAFGDTIGYLQVNSGYTGTLTVNRDLTVTSTLNHDAGAIVVQAELEVGDGWVSQTMTLNATGRLIANGDFQLTASGELAGPGAVEVRGGVFDVDGDFDVGETAIGGGTIRFNAPSPVTATLNLHGGALGGAATITVSDAMLWTGGSMIDSGVTEVAAAAELIISSDDDRSMTDTRVLRNLGQAEWTDGGHIGGLGEPVIENAGDFEALGWGRLNAVRFDNSGTFIKSAETTLTIEGVFDNTCTVDLLGGSLDLWGGGTSSGAFIVSTDATLTLGTYLIDEEGVVTGPGTVWFVGSTTIDGTYDVGVTRVGGSPEFNAAAFTDQLLLESGEISGTDSLTVADFFYWAGGNIGADVSVTNSDRMIIASGDHGLSGTLINNGTVEWISRSSVGGAGTIDNYVDFRITQDVNLGSVGFTFNNYGNLIVQTQGTATLNGDFFNYSDVVVESGNLFITWGESSGTFSITQMDAAVAFLGSYTWDTGTSFSGPGQVIVANVINVLGSVTAANLSLRGGSIGGGGFLTITDKMVWSGGNMLGDGDTTIASGATLYITADVGLDRVLHNHGFMARTGSATVGRNSTPFFQPAAIADFGSASAAAWSEYADDVKNAVQAFAAAENTANTTYTDAEETIAGAYQNDYTIYQADYEDDLADALDIWNSSAQDAAAEAAYWDAVAEAEELFDDAVADTAEAYVNAEATLYDSYWVGLYDGSGSSRGVMETTISAARGTYQAAVNAARRPGAGNVSSLAAAMNAALHGGPVADRQGVWDILSGTTIGASFLSAETRASLARMYFKTYDVEMLADIWDGLGSLFPPLTQAEWDQTYNLYYYGTATGPGTPPTPPNNNTFLSGIRDFVTSAYETIRDLSPATVLDAVQTTWEGVVAAGEAVVTETAGFVHDVAYLLDNDPATLVVAVGQGVRDGNYIVANTLTLGANQALNDHVTQLVNDNGGLYRVAQISAAIGREALVTALTAGTTAIASGAGMGIASNVATRMGVTAATQANVLCRVTTAARLYQPYAAYQQFNGVISAAAQAQEAINRGDYETAAVLLSRAAFNSAGLYGSMRESMRFARAAVTLDPQQIRGYLQACFAAGTPILWEYGEKPVEGFRPGDRVWARNENDPRGPVELRAVEEVFVNLAPIWHLHVADQVIRTTSEHPFYVDGKGWVETKDLRTGDILIGHDGQSLPVQDILETEIWETVYNFRVADHHTYFVGSAAWGFSVWAHNACWNPNPSKGLTATANAYGHWQKHASEFPEFSNALQYVQAARRFVSSPLPGTLGKVRSNGDVLLYHPGTNTLLVQRNGLISTMFRPVAGMSYYLCNNRRGYMDTSPEENERRIKWFEWYSEQTSDHSVILPASKEGLYRCPCCRCKTLSERGAYEICPVCFWEDDGQDDHDADIVRGGPNGALNLSQARKNYQEYGASSEHRKQFVRPPTMEELP